MGCLLRAIADIFFFVLFNDFFYKEIQRDTKRYKEIQRDTKRYKEIRE